MLLTSVWMALATVASVAPAPAQDDSVPSREAQASVMLEDAPPPPPFPGRPQAPRWALCLIPHSSPQHILSALG